MRDHARVAARAPEGVAAFVVLAATHERTLEAVPLDVLKQYAVDVPDDPGSIGAESVVWSRSRAWERSRAPDRCWMA